MKLNKYGLILTLLLFIVSVSSVTATDTDLNCSLSDVNCSNLNNNCLSVNDSSYIENHDVTCDDNDDKYCCGAIAFQSILKENGINITIEETLKSHEERISFLEAEMKEIREEIKEMREEMKKMKEMNKCVFKIQENYGRLLDSTISSVEKENLKNEIKDLKTKINSL